MSQEPYSNEHDDAKILAHARDLLDKFATSWDEPDDLRGIEVTLDALASTLGELSRVPAMAREHPLKDILEALSACGYPLWSSALDDIKTIMEARRAVRYHELPRELLLSAEEARGTLYDGMLDLLNALEEGP